MKMKSILPMALLALLGMGSAASASIIVGGTTNLAGWADGGSAFATCTPDGETTASDLKQSRVDLQSFTLNSGIGAVTEIQLGAIFLANNPGATFTVQMFQLAAGDATNANYASNLGAQVGNTITVPTTVSPVDGSAYNTYGYTSIALTGADQFSMPAGDYAIQIVADSSANAWMKWDLGNDNNHTGNFYTGGIASVRGDTSGNYDFSLAVIPEPATFSLIGVIGGALLFIRRRFMM